MSERLTEEQLQAAKVDHADGLLNVREEGLLATVQGLERQLVNLHEEARLNASMLARQTDLAREAEAREQEQTAALGALAERGLDIAASTEHQDNCPKGKALRRESKKLNFVIPNPKVEAAPCKCGLTEAIARFDEALATDVVKQAVEAWRVKDAEIAVLTARAEAAEQDAMESAQRVLIHREEEDDLNAKLAVAMGLLLRSWRMVSAAQEELELSGWQPVPLCEETAAFFADPLKTAAQYRMSLQMALRT